MKVTVKKRGFIHGKLWKVGDEIEVSAEQFSNNWMTKDSNFEEPEPADNSDVTKGEDLELPQVPAPDLLAKEDKPKKRKRRTKAEIEADKAKESE